MSGKTFSSGQRWSWASVGVGQCRQVTGRFGLLGLVSGSSVSDPVGEFAGAVDAGRWQKGVRIGSRSRSRVVDLGITSSGRLLRNGNEAEPEPFGLVLVVTVAIGARSRVVNSS
jgi:hypothetical protein